MFRYLSEIFSECSLRNLVKIGNILSNIGFCLNLKLEFLLATTLCQSLISSDKLNNYSDHSDPSDFKVSLYYFLKYTYRYLIKIIFC